MQFFTSPQDTPTPQFSALAWTQHKPPQKEWEGHITPVIIAWLTY